MQPGQILAELDREILPHAFARRSHVRAQQLLDRKLVSPSALDEAKTAQDQAENRQRAAEGQLVVSRATIVGLTSSLVPALRASRLDPIEALRYE